MKNIPILHPLRFLTGIAMVSCFLSFSNGATFKVTTKLNTAPSKTINVQTDYTFTFTADPL